MSELIKLDRKTREQAKILYLADHDMVDICEKLDIDMPTLRFFVFGEDGKGGNEKCWFNIKKNINSVAISVYMKDKVAILNKTAGLALDILHENLIKTQEAMKSQEIPLSIDDMKKLAGIVLDMDKMVRLESGMATEIVDEIKHMSLADARKILMDDTFAPRVSEEKNDVPAEFVEVSQSRVEIPSENEIERDREIEQLRKPWE